MTYCLVVDEKGNIIAARSCDNGTFISNAVLVTESVYNTVHEGMASNKQYIMRGGDVVERVVCIDRETAVRRLNTLFMDLVESFTFTGLGEPLQLNQMEREQGLLALRYNQTLPTRSGIILHPSQLDSYLKEFHYHYHRIYNLMNSYVERIKSSTIEDIDKHISNFLREAKNVNKRN